jgi:hypothetical protein
MPCPFSDVSKYLFDKHTAEAMAILKSINKNDYKLILHVASNMI